MKKNLYIFKDRKQASQHICDLFVDLINKKPEASLGFATGTSPLLLYKMLVADHQKNKTDWSKITTFNLDEFVNLDVKHPSSFRKQMQANLFGHLNLKENNIHLPNGNASDLENECTSYDKLLKKHPIDLQFISLGANGHIAYNEPPCKEDSYTHVVDLLDETRHDLKTMKFFNHLDEVPKKAITMGIQSILACKWIVMAVFGEHKQDVGKKMLEDKPNNSIPASYLQNHPNCIFIFDEAASKKLDRTKNNLFFKWNN